MKKNPVAVKEQYDLTRLENFLPKISYFWFDSFLAQFFFEFAVFDFLKFFIWS